MLIFSFNSTSNSVFFLTSEIILSLIVLSIGTEVITLAEIILLWVLYSSTKFSAIELSKDSLFFLVIISINKSVNLESWLE